MTDNPGHRDAEALTSYLAPYALCGLAKLVFLRIHSAIHYELSRLTRALTSVDWPKRAEFRTDRPPLDVDKGRFKGADLRKRIANSSHRQCGVGAAL